MSFDNNLVAKIEELKSQYPDPRSAVMPALYCIQEVYGLIDEKSIVSLSELIDLSPVHIKELVTFYTLYRDKKVGKYHFQLCRTLSCHLRGAQKIAEEIKKRNSDRISFEEVECLGSCGTAPMCQVNDIYFENLTVDKINQILDLLERNDYNLNFSQINNSLGEGIEGYKKSEIK